MPTLLWLRTDLRTQNNPALNWAIAQNQPILAVYIAEDTERPRGGASNWWLHHSLQSLSQTIPLHFAAGKATEILPRLVQEYKIQNICWNRRYTASGIATDTHLKSHFKSQGLHIETFKANLLHEPWDIKTQSGTDF
ncbi:MAG: deoxyribodipyrimidine photo-lyase, partial [Proteobacteria bacterium]|nr:deoxyribodipyrimidine photo-lyase [Pseudomonadota bacterium]